MNLYSQMIRETMASTGRVGAADPRHVEGWMRIEHGCLDGLSRSQFDAEVRIALEFIAAAPLADRYVLTSGSELKLVFPQSTAMPERFVDLDFQHFFLQPMDGLEGKRNTSLAVEYCLAHPQWRLRVHTHKVTGLQWQSLHLAGHAHTRPPRERFPLPDAHPQPQPNQSVFGHTAPDRAVRRRHHHADSAALGRHRDASGHDDRWPTHGHGGHSTTEHRSDQPHGHSAGRGRITPADHERPVRWPHRWTAAYIDANGRSCPAERR